MGPLLCPDVNPVGLVIRFIIVSKVLTRHYINLVSLKAGRHLVWPAYGKKVK